MGHLLTSPLPAFATLGEARAHAAALFAADAVVPGHPVFSDVAAVGPVAVYADGFAEQAMIVSRLADAGMSRVVVVL